MHRGRARGLQRATRRGRQPADLLPGRIQHGWSALGPARSRSHRNGVIAHPPAVPCGPIHRSPAPWPAFGDCLSLPITAPAPSGSIRQSGPVGRQTGRRSAGRGHGHPPTATPGMVLRLEDGAQPVVVTVVDAGDDGLILGVPPHGIQPQDLADHGPATGLGLPQMQGPLHRRMQATAHRDAAQHQTMVGVAGGDSQLLALGIRIAGRALNRPAGPISDANAVNQS